MTIPPLCAFPREDLVALDGAYHANDPAEGGNDADGPKNVVNNATRQGEQERAQGAEPDVFTGRGCLVLLIHDRILLSGSSCAGRTAIGRPQTLLYLTQRTSDARPYIGKTVIERIYYCIRPTPCQGFSTSKSQRHAKICGKFQRKNFKNPLHFNEKYAIIYKLLYPMSKNMGNFRVRGK